MGITCRRVTFSGVVLPWGLRGKLQAYPGMSQRHMKGENFHFLSREPSVKERRDQQGEGELAKTWSGSARNPQRHVCQ